MTANRGSESQFELTVIDRLEALGYRWAAGPDLARPLDEVVLRPALRASLAARYPELDAAALDAAVSRVARPDGANLIARNLDFHKRLVEGFEVAVDRPGGRKEYVHVHPVAWDAPDDNEFLVVNQLPVHGTNDRRPDLVVYVNGLPLAIFELKNPYAAEPTVDEALNQIQHYIRDIPQLFEFNALVVLADGHRTLHGMWPAGMEWYAPWRTVDGVNDAPATDSTMKVLIEGLFPKDRLLAYVRHFVVFETANEKVTKKGAKYHQFFAVRAAVERTRAAFTAHGDKRLGVIWHTTGSGKSLSMVFLVAILRRLPELANPTILLQVDRTDLDDQLHDHFAAARTLVGAVQHAGSRDQLRDLLASGGGEVIFTTIEKFGLKAGPDGRPVEVEHPVLSTRSNIIVIADEAHRSQYGFLKGYARYLAAALPNAKRLGFTGTPVTLGAADTVEVFGSYIHTYDIRQSQLDGATVAIYYAPRLAKLHLATKDIDAELADITEPLDAAGQKAVERQKSKWAQLAAMAGAKERVEAVAEDLLAHFLDRTATLAGKALVVCMTRENCVRLYDALRALPGCPEMKIVMTSNPAKDPVAWNDAGHVTTKHQRDAIKERMEDPADALAIVLVCDMWLTGTDIPCLHTLYVDKPMKGHTVIQAISRVNRVFKDKPHGLVVDYIGIGDELREATDRYTKGGGAGAPAPDVGETARPVFFDALAEIRALLPAGHDWGAWRRLSRIAFDDVSALALAHLASDDELRAHFLAAELKVTKAFLLVKHLDDCRVHADEIIFFQLTRERVRKTMRTPGAPRDVHEAVRDLVDASLQSEGVVDLFKLVGMEHADLSILDDAFLQTFQGQPHDNLRLMLLEKLLADEIDARARSNLVQAKTLRELLEATLAKYHARVIDAAAVIREMIRMRKEMDAGTRRAALLGLSDEELAFYDAILAVHGQVSEEPILRDLVHDVVRVVKANLKVDWTEEHRADVQAAIRAAVKRTLRKHDVSVKEFDVIVERVMAQAKALWSRWPAAA